MQLTGYGNVRAAGVPHGRATVTVQRRCSLTVEFVFDLLAAVADRLDGLLYRVFWHAFFRRLILHFVLLAAGDVRGPERGFEMVSPCLKFFFRLPGRNRG